MFDSGYSYTPFFFCDLKLRKSHHITTCLKYVDTVSIKWDKKAHFLTKEMEIIVVKYPSLKNRHVGKIWSSLHVWTREMSWGLIPILRGVPEVQSSCFELKSCSKNPQVECDYSPLHCTGISNFSPLFGINGQFPLWDVPAGNCVKSCDDIFSKLSTSERGDFDYSLENLSG